ncbi:protein MIZU-KUSSEI 1-like [Magnolia sinica]|uniref:protein MIZU-KUSSEI 1-like n=1 Tax=Magnolia sinica TaxID=86752 RepID=UPI00265A84EA|nr:protein MIZU-KUSSEI 1-like [Magnolia sinica]
MKTIMSKTPHDSSFSSSKRYFQWRRKKGEDEEVLVFNSFSSTCEEEEEDETVGPVTMGPMKKKTAIIRSVMTVFTGKRRWHGRGHRIMGTLFGYRRGHVHFAFQEDPKAGPVFLIELTAPMDGLVMEMASGVVRIALECDKRVEKKGVRLLDEPLWRAYCNGRKCGSAARCECRPAEWKVLKGVEPITMGAGVLPGKGIGAEDEIMYMRARFERVVGSRDSEAFYMINPDGSGGPELSIFLIRV